MNVFQLLAQQLGSDGAASILLGRINSTVTGQQIENKAVNIDVNEAIAFPADNYLTIPSGDINAAMVAISASPTDDISTLANNPCHPSVKYFPLKWNGYPFWMAYTPYPKSDSHYENPCILCSNDGLNWITPVGLTNPICTAPPLQNPPSTGFNSDVNLCMSPDNKTMYLMWRQYNNTQVTLWASQSTDGVNWSDKQQILQFVQTVEDCASFSIMWDGQQYVMWGVNLSSSDEATSTTPKIITRRTASSIYGPWSSSTPCAMNNIPSGKEVWHQEVLNLGNQLLMLCVVATLKGFGFTGQLYLASSTDGLNWTLGNDPVLAATPNRWDLSIYKSSFVLIIKNNEIRLGVWYTSKNVPWRLCYTEIQFNKSQLEANKDLLFFKACNKLNSSLKRGIVIADNFARTDDATGLNTSTSGHTWTNATGIIGISGGLAYAPSAVNSRAVIDVGSPNFEEWVEINVNASGNYIVFRYQDSSNFWRFGYRGGGWFVDKIGGSGGSTSVTLYNAVVAGDRLYVKCIGDNITVKVISNNGYVDYANGILTLTDPLADMATKVGINMDNTTSRFSKFFAKAL